MARSRLSFVTFNLYNLQVPGGLTYPGVEPLSEEEYRAKLRFIALMLEATRADVYGFQELWAAQALRDGFVEAGMEADYDFVARDAPGPGQPQVALATRRGMIDFGGRAPDDEAWWIADFPEELVLRKRRTIEQVAIEIDGFSRPVLTALVKPLAPASAVPVKLYVAHLKSKRPTPLDAEELGRPEVEAHAETIGSALASVRRTAEAAALRVILSNSMLDNTVPHVALGDMNNGSLSVSTSILTGDPRYKVVETSRPVTGRRADLGLYSVERLQQYRSQRHTMYTHIFEGRLETLDHILVSEEFYDHSVNRIWSFVETRVINDHLNLAHARTEIQGAHFWPNDHGIVQTIFESNPF